MHTHTKKKKKKKKGFSTWVWPPRSEIFCFWRTKTKRQKDFCRTREVLTLACCDVGGLASTFDLAIVFAPPRPACGDPPLRRPWFWEQQESRRLCTIPAGTRNRNLLNIGPRKHRGARSFCQENDAPRQSSAKARARLRATNGYSSCAQFSLTHWFDFSFPCSQMEWRVCKRGHTRIRTRDLLICSQPL